MSGHPGLAALAAAVATAGRVVRVVVAETEGSVPREAGAAMLVTPGEIEGTIGGGALEFEAIRRSRRMLAGPGEPWTREVWQMPLGPALGQCCGGRVTLIAELFAAAECVVLDSLRNAERGLWIRPLVNGQPAGLVLHRKAAGPWPLRAGRVIADMLAGAKPFVPELVRTGGDAPAWFIEPVGEARRPLVVYGAGHVGRALVRVLDGLPFAVTWADTAADRFPSVPSPSVARIVTADLPAMAGSVRAGAFHVVLTFSHALDLSICHAVLHRDDFSYLGLIGSATKRARFERRLGELGIAPDRVARLTCPIGLDGLAGKEPAVIAVSVAADLLRRAASARSVNAVPAERSRTA